MIKITKGYKALHIHSKLLFCMFEFTPVDFRFYSFAIIIKQRARHFFGFTFHRWGNPKTINREALPKCAYFSISLLYMPSLDFRVGNHKTWFWIRNENWYGYKCQRRNSRVSF